MLVRMTVALALAVVIVVAFFFMRSRRKSGEAQVARESTPALDAWIAEARHIGHVAVDAEVTLRVRYADGNAGTASKRLPWTDVPATIRADFDARGGSRVFRTWVFPWSRVRAL